MKVATDYTASERTLRGNLEEVKRQQLQVVQSGLLVISATLRAQQSELDEDIARVIDHCLGSRLDGQVGRIGDLIETLQPFPDDSMTEDQQCLPVQ